MIPYGTESVQLFLRINSATKPFSLLVIGLPRTCLLTFRILNSIITIYDYQDYDYGYDDVDDDDDGNG